MLEIQSDIDSDGRLVTQSIKERGVDMHRTGIFCDAFVFRRKSWRFTERDFTLLLRGIMKA